MHYALCTMLHFTAHPNYKGTPSSDIRCFKGIVVTSFIVTPKVTVLKQSNTIALTNAVLTPPSLHTKKPIVSALRLLHIRLQQYRAGKVQIFEVAKVPTINPKRSTLSARQYSLFATILPASSQFSLVGPAMQFYPMRVSQRWVYEFQS